MELMFLKLGLCSVCVVFLGVVLCMLDVDLMSVLIVVIVINHV